MARYTDEFRAHAVILLEMEGYPEQKGALTRVSNQLQVSRANLHRWFRHKSNPPPVKIVNITKEQIEDLLEKRIFSALNQMEDAELDADFKELAVGIAVMIDKLQLLRGLATERIEHGLSDSERASRIEALLERARVGRTRQLTSGDDLLH